MLPGMPGAETRFTIVVLAGGSATRLPGKLALPIDGEPMLARVLRALSFTGAPCVVAASGTLAEELIARIGVPIVFDEHPGEGPLAALVSAAATVRTPYMFAAAGDMPGIDAPFVARVVASAKAADWPDAVVPMRADGTIEPLAALYKVEPWLTTAREQLAQGRRNVTSALEGLRVAHYAVVPEDEAALANINTPSDYEHVRGAPPVHDRRT